MGGKSSTWIGGAVVVALLIMIGGWFVAISPTLDSASAASADADAATARNEQLRLQLATLKKQFERLDEYKAELAAARIEIPSQGELTTFARQVDALGTAAGVTVVSVAPGTPTIFAPVAPTQPVAPEPTDGATEGTDGDTAAPAAPAGPAPIDGFVAVPVDITVVSAVPNAMAFLSTLQGDGQRLFLVTAFRGTGQAESEPSGGRPATKDGDVELTISGYIYVLKQPAAAPDVATDPTTPPALPVPADGTDPFTGA